MLLLTCLLEILDMKRRKKNHAEHFLSRKVRNNSSRLVLKHIGKNDDMVVSAVRCSMKKMMD
jgi:hypothetical protein